MMTSFCRANGIILCRKKTVFLSIEWNSIRLGRYDHEKVFSRSHSCNNNQNSTQNSTMVTFLSA